MDTHTLACMHTCTYMHNDLWYVVYTPQKFKSNRITLAELKYIDESTLEQLGIPLGPRLRILAEVKSLEPCSVEGR